MRGTHPQSHVTIRYRGHVTNQKRYIITQQTTESLRLPKINSKMTTRTKNGEMNKVVNLCLCESRDLKIGRSNHRRCSINKMFLKNLQKLTGEHLCPSPTQIFSCHFNDIFENTFFTEHFRATAFDI